MDQRVAPRRGERKGDFLGGKYLLGDCLGIGGMGEVYRATNVSLGRTVAIKVLSSQFVDREEDVLRFLREARAAAAVRHAHVVDVLDVARDDDGTPFIVQEFLDGEDLERYLRIRDGRLSCEEALEIMTPVADAVAVAHTQGVVHRDLKPANIFLARERNKISPKVLDFGACVFPTMAERSAKEIQMLIGTPQYMAPEQIVDKQSVDARSDVWALGIILWELVVGETPFEAATASEVLKLVKTRDVPLLRQRAHDAPVDLELLIARCTVRDRMGRPPDAGAVHEAMLEILRRMRGGGPSISQSMTLSEPPPDLDSEPIAPKAPPPRAVDVPSLDAAGRRARAALRMTLNDPGSEPPRALEEFDTPRSLNELGPADAPPLELAARPSSWPPVLRPPEKSTATTSSMPPVLFGASGKTSSSNPPPARATSSSNPPVRAAMSSIPPILAVPQFPWVDEAAPPSSRSAPDARPRPPAVLTSGATPRAKLVWTTADIARFALAVGVPAVAAFVVVRAVPALGAPVGSALRGDSTLASGVLAVVALIVAAALSARSVLGEKSRWLYFAAAGSVLFGIVMIIVTFAASEAAELGVPAAMAGISTAVAPLAPFVLGLSALVNARKRWVDPYSRPEAIRSAVVASAMLFLILALGPLGVVHTTARTSPASHGAAAH